MVKILQKYWYYAYLVILVGGVIYTSLVLRREDLQVSNKTKKPVPPDERLVSVNVTVDNDLSETTYKAKLKNVDTVYDTIDKLRADQGFYYEITDYLYGTQIDCINKKCAGPNYIWKVYLENKDVTTEIKNANFDKGANILIKLEKK